MFQFLPIIKGHPITGLISTLISIVPSRSRTQCEVHFFLVNKVALKYLERNAKGYQ